MDAFQGQAMATATQARRAARRERAAEALTRMSTGDFGSYTGSGDDIPRGRLDLDPTTPTCVDCATR